MVTVARNNASVWMVENVTRIPDTVIVFLGGGANTVVKVQIQTQKAYCYNNKHKNNCCKIENDIDLNCQVECQVTVEKAFYL